MRDFVQKNRYFSHAGRIVKFVLFFAVAWCLYDILSSEDFRREAFLQALNQAWRHAPAVFLCSFLLMFLNWSLEAAKWQLLARKVEKISFREALKGVMAGLGIGLLAPQGIGDYAGRTFRLQSRERFRSVGAFLFGNTVQLFTALFFGCIASSVLLLLYKPGSLEILYILMPLEAVILAFFASMIFGADRLMVRFSKVKLLSRFYHYLETAGTFSARESRKILLISTIRYLVFSLQFILILKAFQIPLSLPELFAVVSSVFLVKTIVPAFNFLGDLGIREVSSVYFFGLFHISEEPVLAASLCVWFINIFFPTICGLIFIPKMTFRTHA